MNQPTPASPSIDAAVHAALSYADFLLMCAEPLKARSFLQDKTPVFIKNHPDIEAKIERITQACQHFFDDKVYVERYSKYTNGLDNFGPFCDPGILNLPRTQFAIQAAETCYPTTMLSIGGGEGSLGRELLARIPESLLFLSELQQGKNEVADALNNMFPGRVSVVGRYDVKMHNQHPDHMDQFDFIECLEVIEHVAHPGHLVRNIIDSLTEDGVAVISTPNAEDWVERKHITDLGDPNHWYHHLRAYDAKELEEVINNQADPGEIKLEIFQGYKQLIAKITKLV